MVSKLLLIFETLTTVIRAVNEYLMKRSETEAVDQAKKTKNTSGIEKLFNRK